MAYRTKVTIAFLAFACLMVFVIMVAIHPTALSEKHVIGSGETVELCIPATHPDLPDLLSGSRRAVLVVHAFHPAGKGEGSLRVLFTATRSESRIGFFPAGAFSEASGDQARRYFLPTAKNADTGDLCFSITLEGAVGSRVEVSLDVSEKLRD